MKKISKLANAIASYLLASNELLTKEHEKPSISHEKVVYFSKHLSTRSEKKNVNTIEEYLALVFTLAKENYEITKKNVGIYNNAAVWKLAQKTYESLITNLEIVEILKVIRSFKD